MAHAGSLLMAMPIVMAAVAPVRGWLSDRIGSRLPTVMGMACTAAGMWLLGRLVLGASDQQVILRLGLVGGRSQGHTITRWPSGPGSPCSAP